jgi:hypothetical protein
MASPSNPVTVPIVTYEYLICLPSSEQPRPPARWMTQGLLSGSCTPNITGRRLRPKEIWIQPSSLQRQMIGEPSTPYQIWSLFSWLKGREQQLKRTKPRHDLYQSFYPTSMATSGQDLATRGGLQY